MANSCLVKLMALSLLGPVSGLQHAYDPFPHGFALSCLLRVGNEFKLNAERRVLAGKGKPLGKLLGDVAVPCQPEATERMLACA